MCEYSSGCKIVTDPTARALAAKPREDAAIGLVLCPPEHQILAAAYHLPELGGDVLCVPRMEVRAGSWLGPGHIGDPNELLHWHPQIVRLEDFGPDDIWFGRCKHGTWCYQPAYLLRMIEAERDGRLLPPGDLVKVKHSNGRVTKIGRVHAESSGLQIVGGVVRNSRLTRPYILGSYVAMSDGDSPED